MGKAEDYVALMTVMSLEVELPKIVRKIRGGDLTQIMGFEI